MADVNAEQVTTAGLDPTVSTATFPAGDTVPPDVIVRVSNPTAGPLTLTVVTPGTVDGLAIADRDVVVPASESRYVLLPRSLYRDASDGRVHLTWSAAGCTFEVIR